VCVRPLSGSLLEGVFSYVYVRPPQSQFPSALNIPIAETQNYVSTYPSLPILQPQPTTFLANLASTLAGSFTVTFPSTAEVQWALQYNGSMASLGARQVAVLNNYSPRCNAPLQGAVTEAIEPLMDSCIAQRSGGTVCTFAGGYYNPNPQTMQLPVGSLNQFVSFVGSAPVQQSQQQPDRRQPRVFWPGTISSAVQFDFDCSQNLWALEWQLTTLNTTRRLRVDQSSVC